MEIYEYGDINITVNLCTIKANYEIIGKIYFARPIC